MPRINLYAVNVVASNSLRSSDKTLRQHLSRLFPRLVDANDTPVIYLNQQQRTELALTPGWDNDREAPDLLVLKAGESLAAAAPILAIGKWRRPLLLVVPPPRGQKGSWHYALTHRRLFKRGMNGMVEASFDKTGEMTGDFNLIRMNQGSPKPISKKLNPEEKRFLLYP